MKKHISTLLFLGLVGILLAACQPTIVNATEIGAQDAGKTISINKGDVLVVLLEGNITTGFTWVPAPQDPALLEQVGDVEVAPAHDALGAPGMIILRFKAANTGQASLRLEYKRPWEKDIPAEKTFEVTVVVK